MVGTGYQPEHVSMRGWSIKPSLHPGANKSFAYDHWLLSPQKVTNHLVWSVWSWGLVMVASNCVRCHLVPLGATWCHWERRPHVVGNRWCHVSAGRQANSESGPRGEPDFSRFGIAAALDEWMKRLHRGRYGACTGWTDKCWSFDWLMLIGLLVGWLVCSW